MTPAQVWFERAGRAPGAPGVREIEVTAAEWSRIAADAAATGGRLVALWAETAACGPAVVRAAFAAGGGLLVATLCVAAGDPPYPGLQELFPAASRMQRAIADGPGPLSTDPDRRPWLAHPPGAAAYAFTRVEGEGVHEIPVGPVHAGIIEPGHFRFSVVGEKVLRLEERLGYVHKGIERRFTELGILDGQRLAARVSGDSAVAYSWAYVQALEALAGIEPPARALWLRVLCLELERIANHLGDLGALANDAGFGFGLAQFSRLKEQLLRANEALFGQRYLLDVVVPGGLRADVEAAAATNLGATLAAIAAETAILRGIYDEHAGLRGRFGGAGVVTPVLAARLGLTGAAGRASGQAFDWRVDAPASPYDVLGVRLCTQQAGDVAARVSLRFDELFESCRLCRAVLDGMPTGGHRVPVPEPPGDRLAVGLVEGWRGPVLVGLVAAAGGGIRRCHPHDPSWQNWPVLEHAILDNIVPDFPLINKSFNLSYSGHDL